MRKFLHIALLLSIALSAHGQKRPYVAPAEEDVRANIAQWQDLKFGMFMHWGTYSQLGVIESWTICPELTEWEYKGRPEGMTYMEYLRFYEHLKDTFNPIHFDPDKWAEAAEYAGMKYVVFTTKHHDGFNMFDTNLTDYKVTDEGCPFHSNPRSNIAKEVFNSFRAKGLKAGAYFSIADWHNNDYWWKFFSPKDRYINYDPARWPEKMTSFEDYVESQVRELTNGDYGKIDLMWLDLCEISETYEIHFPWGRIAAAAREGQPGMITVARGTHSAYENYLTSELKIPTEVWNCPWEACMPMTQSWSYNRQPKYKSTQTLLNMLVQVVSRGGNFLLNVGPDPLGILDDEVYARLRGIGDWMKVNSEGIYGTKPVAPHHVGNVYFTAKDEYVYAFYAADDGDNNIPDKIFIGDVVPQGSYVTMLGSNVRLKWKKGSDGVYVNIPESLRKIAPCDYVFCLKIKV